MIWKKIASYLTISRKNKEGSPNFSLWMMHGINRISITMFLIAVIILIIRRLF